MTFSLTASVFADTVCDKATDQVIEHAIKTLADQGDANFQYLLAEMYEKGNCVARDERLAAALYRKAADQGNTNAQNNLGVMYATGRGVSPNRDEAARLFALAATHGNTAAQANLFNYYRMGIGIPDDEKEIMATVGALVELDVDHSKALPGMSCAYKFWAPQLDVLAAILCDKAANLGNDDALFGMGVRHKIGRSVNRSNYLAAYWFRKSAARANALAMDELAGLYTKGDGVNQSNVIAYALYNLSTLQDASDRNPSWGHLKDLSTEMTDDQQREGAQMILEMRKPGGLLHVLDAASEAAQAI